MGPRELFLIHRERWLLAGGCALLAVCLAAFYVMSRPRVYEATAGLLLEMPEAVAAAMAKEGATDGDAEADPVLPEPWSTHLQNHARLITSGIFRQQVIRTFRHYERTRVVRPHTPEGGETPALDEVLRESVTAGVAPGSSVLLVTSRHPVPEQAAMIANRFAETYIRFAYQRSLEGDAEAAEYFRAQAETERERADAAESELAAFLREHELPGDSVAVMERELAEIRETRTTARLERAELTEAIAEVERRIKAGRELSSLSRIATRGQLPSLLEELAKLRWQRETMAATYGSRHPRMIENERAIQSVRDLIREEETAAADDLRANLRELKAGLAEWDALIAEKERDLLRLREVAPLHRTLLRKVEEARLAHAQILEQMEARETAAFSISPRFSSVDQAVVPDRPVEPDYHEAAIAIAILGLAVFLLVPLLAEMVDHRLKTVWDVKTFLGQNMLGRFSLPFPEDGDEAATLHRQLLEAWEGNSGKEFPKTILVTSSVAGEGKSRVAAALAKALAHAGKSVLLVDANLRHPELHRLTNSDNASGLLSFFPKGDSPTDPPAAEDPRAVLRELSSGLSLLAAGGHVAKADELLRKDQFRNILQSLRKDFDSVVIDSPAAANHPDARILADWADEILHVARIGKASRQKHRRVIRHLSKSQADIVGVLLTQERKSERSSRLEKESA